MDDTLYASQEHRKILAAALDLLQLIVTRDEVDIHTLQDLRIALETRLYLCIHQRCFDLQNKALHALHSVLAAMASRMDRKGRQRSSSLSRAETSGFSRKHILTATDGLLLRTISDAIALQENSAILHHWIDFLLMTLPHLRENIPAFTLGLGAQISGRLSAMVSEMAIANDPQRKGKEVSILVSDADFTVLVNAQERLFALAAEDKSLSSAQSIESTKLGPTEKAPSAEASVGILGFIGSALGGTDAAIVTATTSPEVRKWAWNLLADLIAVSQNQSPLHQAMSQFVDILLRAWQLASETERDPQSSQAISHVSMAKHIRMRSRKALDRLYKAHPTLILDIIIEAWIVSAYSGHSCASTNDRASLLDLLDLLSPAPQAVIAMLCDWLSAHSPPERGKVQTIPPGR